VDSQVKKALLEGKSLYFIDEEQLRALKPDIILTQSLCNVCSIDLEQVSIFAQTCNPIPVIVSLNPHNLEQVLESLVEVGMAVGMELQATTRRIELEQRVANATVHEPLNRPNIAFIEWSDPLYVGGHWTPQLIHFAGGIHKLNTQIGIKSFAVEYSVLVENDPDAIIVCPCGLDIEKTKEMIEDLEQHTWWSKLRAVKEGKVVMVDGNHMFNRSGPRLVDCLEWLNTWIASNCDASKLSSDFPFEVYFHTGTIKIPQDQVLVDIENAHSLAMVRGELTYIDPKTGFNVFTEKAALDRGICCGRGCRHCP